MQIKEMIGWELLYSIIEKDIKTEKNIIVAIIHWYFIKNAGFLCLGLGNDHDKVANDEEGSELLPKGWADNEECLLQYSLNNELYHLKCYCDNSDQTLTCVLWQKSSSKLTNNFFVIPNTVKSMQGSLETLVPDIRTVLNTIKWDLLNPLLHNNNGISTQTDFKESDDNRQTSFERHRERELSNIRHPIEPWRQVGSRDLNPLGTGGGMVFDPFNMPSGIRGARYEPIGPFDGRGFRGIRNPNNDHFPPPGLSDHDDIYM